MILRAPVAADAHALAQFGRDSFIAKFGHLYSNENLVRFLNETHSHANVAKEIASPTMAIRLAEEQGVLVGMCKLLLDSSLKQYGTTQRPLEIKQLYAAPSRTGQGIGTALMDWAMRFASDHGTDEVQLSVWSENYGAQRFYRRYGFEKIADIDFWVGDHRDEEFLFARRI